MRTHYDLKEKGILHTVVMGENFSGEIEMSGLGVDFFVGYGADTAGKLLLTRYMVFPALRTIPNNTCASFQCALPEEKIPVLLSDGIPLTEQASAFSFDGVLTVESRCGELTITRHFFPASEEKAAFERILICNHGKKTVFFSFSSHEALLCRGRGTKGCYRVEAHVSGNDSSLEPGACATWDICYIAKIANEHHITLYGEKELEKRYAKIEKIENQCTLESENPLLDCFFAFAKLRAQESIFKTDGGLLHSPGGRSYYAATWCNDQVEYAGPYFALTGDQIAMEASLNAYKQYIPFMDDNYHRIPSSVIAEGRDIWEGAGDRGDAAMYLYGASLFCLYSGSREVTAELWDAIKWCAEYCRRKTLPEGVIASDTDELEGRFPTDGRANLSTSCLCYGGLKEAALLAVEMGEKELAAEYNKRAEALALSIEKYFGATLHGFNTYRYSAGIDTLRAWICLPLVMGLTERKEGTIAALLSPYLNGGNGMLSCERGKENTSDTVWDRAELYFFRGAFLCGVGNVIWKNFSNYIEDRLLGKRAPYAVEAWPEGNMRHLSGESALFCRVILEGMLGLEMEGLHHFAITPRLPDDLSHIYLKNMEIGGLLFDIYADHHVTQVFERGTLLCEFPAGVRALV